MNQKIETIDLPLAGARSCGDAYGVQPPGRQLRCTDLLRFQVSAQVRFRPPARRLVPGLAVELLRLALRCAAGHGAALLVALLPHAMDPRTCKSWQ
jgi:hypothetical protein